MLVVFPPAHTFKDLALRDFPFNNFLKWVIWILPLGPLLGPPYFQTKVVRKIRREKDGGYRKYRHKREVSTSDSERERRHQSATDFRPTRTLMTKLKKAKVSADSWFDSYPDRPAQGAGDEGSDMD